MNELCLAIDTDNVNRVCTEQKVLVLDRADTSRVTETLEALTYGIEGMDARIYALPSAKVIVNAAFRLLRPQIVVYREADLFVTTTERGGWVLGIHGYVTLHDHQKPTTTSHGIPGALHAAAIRTLVACGDPAALPSRARGLYVPSGDWHSVRVIYTSRSERLNAQPEGAQWIKASDIQELRHRFDLGSKQLLDAILSGTLDLWGFKRPATRPSETGA